MSIFYHKITEITMKTYSIHFIRHGLTQGASEGRYIGHTDEPLSEEGKAQLLEMKEQFIYPDAEVVISSPLLRAKETAGIIYPGKAPLELPGFIECDFGEFENLTAEELAPYPEFAQWLSGGTDASPLNGESNRAFQYRVCSAFEKTAEGLFRTGCTSAAIITHGGVIGTLLAAYGIPEQPMHTWLAPCGCGFTVRLTPSVWSRVMKFEIIYELPYPKDNGVFQDDAQTEE